MSKEEGQKFDSDKAALDLIPEVALIGMAHGFGHGFDKYDAPNGTRYNYRKGLKYTRLTNSLRRHILAFLLGEDIDPDSGLPHTWLILANGAMLEYMRTYRTDMDDRFKYPEVNQKVSELMTRPKSTEEKHPKEDNNQLSLFDQKPETCGFCELPCGNPWCITKRKK